MKKIDMHMHTTMSDGDLNVENTYDLAKKNGCSLIAITDHEYLEDYSYLNGNSPNDVEVVNGIEFNTEEKGVHVLGYCIKNIDYINNFINNLHKENEHVSFELIEKLKALGYDISKEQVNEYMNSIGITYKYLDKRHIARYLIDKHYTKNVYDTYANLIGAGTDLYIPLKKVSIEDIISLIKDGEGIAVMAHPATLKMDENDLMYRIKELTEHGLDGLEIYNRKADKDINYIYTKIADECGLLKTVGSDFHTPTTDEIGIGVSEEFYEKVKRKLR